MNIKHNCSIQITNMKHYWDISAIYNIIHNTFLLVWKYLPVHWPLHVKALLRATYCKIWLDWWLDCFQSMYLLQQEVCQFIITACSQGLGLRINTDFSKLTYLRNSGNKSNGKNYGITTLRGYSLFYFVANTQIKDAKTENAQHNK